MSGGLGASAPPQTAKQILAAVISLDGVGSGLDADTVRGQHVVAAPLPGQGAPCCAPIPQPGTLYPVHKGRTLASNYFGR